jgi:hypothetical protein
VADQNSGPDSKGYEKTDARIKAVYVFLISLGLLIVLALVSMSWMFSYLETMEAARDVPASALADPNAVPPQPRLNRTSRGELDQVLSKSRAKLKGYSWIDKEEGVVQIPIERAMELMTEKGLPMMSQESEKNDEGQR